jgi:phosphatidate phosphatase APP1
MAGWYQEMARNGHLSDANPDSGFAREPVIFHYLSAGPLQLYPVLSEFLKDAHFPEGILHLRESTSMRTLYAGRKTTIAHKKAVLTRLFETYPQRKFILIGDSGENDPEIYADIARSYPGRVLAIHIRNVTDEGRAAPRYQQTFTGIEPQTWHIRD